MIGREDETRIIRDRISAPAPSLTLLSGPRGSGKTTVLRGALSRERTVWYQATFLTDPDHRALVVARLLRHLPDGVGPVAPIYQLRSDADWPAIFQALADSLYESQERIIMVLDGWHRLVEARSRIVGHLADFWQDVRRRGIQIHLVISTNVGSTVRPFRDPDHSLSEWLDEDLSLGPLPYRAVTRLLSPDLPARERLTTYGVFGGWPDVVQHVDPERTLEENLREAVLDGGAPLVEWGIDLLARQIQAPARYASIIRALADGAREWGEIREKSPDFGSSGQMAPYIQRLEEMGLINIERSLDASPRSRSRRYFLVDPFTVFWFRFVLPHLTEIQTGRGERVWEEIVRPNLESHLNNVFPEICRTFLEKYGGDRLPALAREIGGLWGQGYDLNVAGILANGSVFYGTALWGLERPGVALAEEITTQIDRTRYGFGRETRHRFIFSDKETSSALSRRAARGQPVTLFGPSHLLD